MNHLLATLLLGSACAATAAPGNPCDAPSTATKWAYADLSASKAGFDCAPSPIGAGTFPTVRSNAAGRIAWWYCPTIDGTWRTNWGVATAARLSGKGMFDDIGAVAMAADPLTAFAVMVDKNVKMPLTDPSLTPVWCPFVAEMTAGAPKALVKSTTTASVPLGSLVAVTIKSPISATPP